MPSKRIEVAELKELAAARERLRVHLEVEQLARLADQLEAPDESGASSVCIDADVAFETGGEGFPRLAIAVDGRVSLRCQRCLGPLDWPVRLTTRLAVLDNDGQAEQLAEPFDSILMDADGLALEAVIEDEILAALPMAPVHEPGQCVNAAVPVEALDSDNETGQTYRPFADLATMIRSPDGE